MTRLLVLGALTLSVLLWNCGGPEKEKMQGQSEPAPVIPDSIRNKPKLPIELNNWRLLTYTKNGVEQTMEGSDSVSITIKFLYGEASGSTGCNDYRIPCAVDLAGTLAFGDSLAHSSRVCRGLMPQERFLQAAIPTMNSYTISADRRRLELSSGEVKLLFIGIIPESDKTNAPKADSPK